jgi:hypothetical protein
LKARNGDLSFFICFMIMRIATETDWPPIGSLFLSFISSFDKTKTAKHRAFVDGISNGYVIEFLQRVSVVSVVAAEQPIDCVYQGRGSSVGITTRYGLDDPGIEYRCGRDFPRPALGPT